MQLHVYILEELGRHNYDYNYCFLFLFTFPMQCVGGDLPMVEDCAVEYSDDNSDCNLRVVDENKNPQTTLHVCKYYRILCF